MKVVKHLAKTGTFAGLYQTDQAVLISLQTRTRATARMGR